MICVIQSNSICSTEKCGARKQGCQKYVSPGRRTAQNSFCLILPFIQEDMISIMVTIPSCVMINQNGNHKRITHAFVTIHLLILENQSAPLKRFVDKYHYKLSDQSVSFLLSI